MPTSDRLTRRASLRVLGVGAALGLLAPSWSGLAHAEEIGRGWMRAARPLRLWSGPGASALVLGVAARGDYLQVAAPRQQTRVYVFVARTRNYAWADVDGLQPSGPAPLGWPFPATPQPPDPSQVWVAVQDDTSMWLDPADNSALLGIVPAATLLHLVEDLAGPRLHVADPFTHAPSFVDADAVQSVDPPDEPLVPIHWWGSLAASGAYLRPTPAHASLITAELPSGAPVVVERWVPGDELVPDNPTWARLADGAFVYSATLRAATLQRVPDPPADAPDDGRWIDLNLTHQLVVAYDGPTPVYSARTSTGRPGWETDAGSFKILRRVESETMDSTTLIGLDARKADYKLEHVRWTQYFTGDGKALHENYWKPAAEFGIPSSHGCAGLLAEDAQFFWTFATVGTPVLSHY